MSALQLSSVDKLIKMEDQDGFRQVDSQDFIDSDVVERILSSNVNVKYEDVFVNSDQHLVVEELDLS